MKVREIRGDEEEGEGAVEEEDEGRRVFEEITNLSIEMSGTKEEAAEGITAAQEMEVEEDRGARERKSVGGLNGNWETLSSSIRKLSRAELRSLMPVMGPKR